MKMKPEYLVRLAALFAGLMFMFSQPAQAEPSYSVRELQQSDPLPAGTRIRLHADIYQGMHGIILQDEHCSAACDDITSLHIETEQAKASYARVQSQTDTPMGCCGDRRAHFDMIVVPVYRRYPNARDDTTSTPRMRLAYVELIEILEISSHSRSN